jgi:hypothetical protein
MPLTVVGGPLFWSRARLADTGSGVLPDVIAYLSRSCYGRLFSGWVDRLPAQELPHDLVGH